MNGTSAPTRKPKSNCTGPRWTRPCQAVLDGRLHNPSAVVGILAAAAARADNFEGLRPADAPWPAHPSQRR